MGLINTSNTSHLLHFPERITEVQGRHSFYKITQPGSFKIPGHQFELRPVDLTVCLSLLVFCFVLFYFETRSLYVALASLELLFCFRFFKSGFLFLTLAVLEPSL